MKKDLLSIAMGLSEKDIQKLAKLHKDGSKKLTELRRERKKLAAALAKVDRQIAALDVETEAPARRTRKTRAAKPVAGKGRKAKRGGAGLTDAVREILSKSSTPMRASEIVDALPGEGVSVKDVQATRKRVSIILASQKKSFAQSGRGLYKIVR